jgi:hypothetical protein
VLPPVPYTSIDGTEFRFVNSLNDANGAELECNKLCGHLASYSSVAQQSEVEQFYESSVSGGALAGRPAAPLLWQAAPCSWPQ